MTVFTTKEDFLRLGLKPIKLTLSHASQNCSVCLDTLQVHPPHTNEEPSKFHPAVRIIACGHILGEDCLDAWLRVGNTCPSCNRFLFEPTDDPITQQDVDSVLRALRPFYGEQQIMTVITRVIARGEEEYAHRREKQAAEMAKKIAKEQQERDREFIMPDEDFHDSDAEFEFDKEMEDGDEYDFDDDMEDDDASGSLE